MQLIKALWHYLFASKTLTGEIRNRTIYLDGVTLENAQLYQCRLVYYGFGTMRYYGGNEVTKCKLALGGMAANGVSMAKFITSEDTNEKPRPNE